MNKKLAIVGIVAIALVFAISVSAINACDGHGKSSWSKCSGKSGKWDLESKFYMKAYMIIKNSDELGLSDKMVDKIRELKMSTKKSLVMKKAEIEVIGLDIKSMLHGDTVNIEEINKLIDKKYDLKKEKTKSIVAACVTLKSYLSEDQMDKLKKLCKRCKTDK